jgi:hypothetical protein
MATQRRFVRQRFASHAAFSRIRSRFRNPVISSLSTAFPYAKGPRAKNSPALHEGIVRSGQEIGRRIGYHQVTEFDASAPSRRRSRACLALTSRRGTDVRTGRPYPPKGGRTFSRCARDRVERPAPPPAKSRIFGSRLSYVRDMILRPCGARRSAKHGSGAELEAFAGDLHSSARGTVRSRDLAQAEDCDIVHAVVWLPSRTNHHRDTSRGGREKRFCVQRADRIVHKSINVPPLFSLNSILPGNRLVHKSRLAHK